MASIWAVGDIHGEYRMMDALLAAMEPIRKPGDVTVYLGDYIDFGMDSAAVVGRVLSERAARPGHTVSLWGNHEDVAAHFYGIPTPADGSRGEVDRKWWINESLGGGFTLG